jgi:uncharacterized protein YfaS (alpha-2-macroglobulin family)
MNYKYVLSCLFLSVLSLTLCAQQKPNDYAAAWKKIDSLIQKKGLVQSAVAEINKIYARAKAEKNDPQLIKALVYRAGISESFTEDALEKTVKEFEKEILVAKEPARSILNSITADIYLNYFQQNRWKLYDRTATVDFQKDDIATWSVDDFHKKIMALLDASLKSPSILQKILLTQYDAVVLKGNTRVLRPTVYDLLAHKALEYYKAEEMNITRPAYSFELNDDRLFGDAAAFIALKLESKDSISASFKALRLYQQILRFHLHDERPDPLIDADIDRIEFVHSHSVNPQKDSLYRLALIRFTEKYKDHSVAAQAWYLLAETYAAKVGNYQPITNEQGRFEYLKAKQICESVILQKDSSEGKSNCENLLTRILAKELNMETEKVNVPGEPFRTLISYRNLTGLSFRIIPMDKTTRESLTEKGIVDSFWIKLTRIPAIKSFLKQLPDTKDHQQHSAEIAVEALPVGEYALIASTDADFGLGRNMMAVQFFHVSNLSYIQKGNDYYVLHRETGQPVARANIQAWYRYYDASTRKNKDRKGEHLFTDKNGHFHIASSRNRQENNFRIEIATTDDRLFLGDYQYPVYRYIPEAIEKETLNTFLFTDRSIYRPGQTVFFKGIIVKKDKPGDKSTIVPAYSTRVFLYDANGEAVDSVTIKTNEFGSYSGKFSLPLNVLNGEFRIEDENTDGSHGFSVEEYKRPKFAVELEKPSGTYRLHDTIIVKGNAKAFAGNNIDGAVVKYRVVRRTVFPLWAYGYERMIWPPRPGREFEITHGETKTGANGEFSISFQAIPDLNVDKKTRPSFYYEVSADVTDINGETRSNSSSVNVSYQALKLTLEVPEKLHTDSIGSIKLRSTNPNDVYEKISFGLSIHKLKTPARLFRSRYWKQPDQFVMTKEEYYRLFPYDIYADENDPSKWERMGTVIQFSDTSSPNGTLRANYPKLAAGWYVVEAVTKDKYGEEVKDVRYVQLYNDTIVNPIAFGSLETGKQLYEPGEKAMYHMHTNLDSLFVIHEIDNTKDSAQIRFLRINNTKNSFELPVTEDYRGGFGIGIAFVKHNRVYIDEQSLLVPYTNKELRITQESFRDKTLPGAAETWKVKITGFKKEKLAAELLTAMYDASLDEFRNSAWYKPYLYNSYAGEYSWQADKAFNTVTSSSRLINYHAGYYIKTYDRLISAEFFEDGRDRVFTRVEYGMIGPPKAAAARSEGLANVKLNADWKNDPDGSKGLMAEEVAAQGEMYIEGTKIPKGGSEAQEPVQVQPRKNFNETAFFFPDLRTDSAGNISFSFTMPEALTQWKWMMLAHTKDLAFGYDEKTIITQKDLMVQPNPPRFLRQGDRMDFSAKIVNITDREITGQVQLQFFDAETNAPVDGWFNNVFPNQYFTAAAKQSTPVSFTIEIPYLYNKPLLYRITAKANDSGAVSMGSLSDGEEAYIPVLSNRLLVTESLPLNMGTKTEKQFRFDKLLNSGNSETLQQHALTVEYSSNPVWYAVQALPYLSEYPYECAEQTFNRYYANALASMIANASPRIREVFEKWKTTDTAALLSNLQKNQELKSILLQETPWVMEAKTEAEQKKQIALLFDMVRMTREQNASLNKLLALQTSNGGFAWFPEGRDDRFITQYILTGIGHLQKLGALPPNNPIISQITERGIRYLDQRIKEDFDALVKASKQASPVNDNLGSIQIQYLYMRSFYTNRAVPGDVFKAYNYYRKQAQQFWIRKVRYMQGMIALSLNRTGEGVIARSIMESLKQTAVRNEELGMYWKEITNGIYWHQAPIETHSLLMEAFAEISKDPRLLGELRTWLLKQKQTRDWRTTKATAEACYALLLAPGTTGSNESLKNLLAAEPEISIRLGDQQVSSKTAEAGTGYFKQTIEGKNVKPSMGNINVSVRNAGTSGSWGSVYWQYFENLENITAAASPLKISKKLFVEKNSDRGPVLQPVTEAEGLRIGDKVRIRIEIRTDRDMEYVHLKDMRAAGMEPLNVFSSYKWQGGLGYYETTKDASTNFFFDRLPRGVYVFEYSVFITHTGTFSNGISSIQCMYAPEFSSHSEGIKVSVE